MKFLRIRLLTTHTKPYALYTTSKLWHKMCKMQFKGFYAKLFLNSILWANSGDTEVAWVGNCLRQRKLRKIRETSRFRTVLTVVLKTYKAKVWPSICNKWLLKYNIIHCILHVAIDKDDLVLRRCVHESWRLVREISARLVGVFFRAVSTRWNVRCCLKHPQAVQRLEVVYKSLPVTSTLGPLKVACSEQIAGSR